VLDLSVIVGGVLAPNADGELAAERLGIVPDDIAAGHRVALSRPHQLTDLLDLYARTPAE
jgi:hypothetical protein